MCGDSYGFRGGEDGRMNKRQWKKKYKKEHGCNPPSKRQVQTWEEEIGNFVNGVIDIVNHAFKAINDYMEKLKSMPEDEFEEKNSQLTLGQQALARKIRNNGKEQK